MIKKFGTEGEYRMALYAHLQSLLTNYGDFTSKGNIDAIEFREIGLESMAVVGIFLELEGDGWIDISLIDNNAPPATILDILELGVKSYKSIPHENI